MFINSGCILDDVGDGDEVVLDDAVRVESRERELPVDKVVELALLRLFRTRPHVGQHVAR